MNDPKFKRTLAITSACKMGKIRNLAAGRVARLGQPFEVLEQPVVEQVYQCPVSIGHNPKTGRPRVQIEWDDEPARPASTMENSP